MVDEKKVECPWCVQTEFKCGIDKPDYPALEKCDFRSLPKEPEAIKTRMRELVRDIHDSQELIKHSKVRGEQEKAVMNVLDKMFGLEKMVQCLESEFGMNRQKVLEEVGFKGMTMVEKAKAVMALKRLQRGSK